MPRDQDPIRDRQGILRFRLLDQGQGQGLLIQALGETASEWHDFYSFQLFN